MEYGGGADAARELYLALKTGTVKARDNPLPTNEAAKIYEVTKQILMTSHIIGQLWPIIPEETCGVVALGVMFGAIIVQVVFRYLFTPLIWPFELSIYMYICLI